MLKNLILAAMLTSSFGTVINIEELPQDTQIWYVGNFNYGYDNEWSFLLNNGDYTSGQCVVHYSTYFNYDLYLDNANGSYGEEITTQTYLHIYNWTYTIDISYHGDFDGYETYALPTIFGDYNEELENFNGNDRTIIYDVEDLSRNFTLTFGIGGVYQSNTLYINCTNYEDLSGMDTHVIPMTQYADFKYSQYTLQPYSYYNGVWSHTIYDSKMFNNLTIETMNIYNLLVKSSQETGQLINDAYNNGYFTGYGKGHKDGYTEGLNSDSTITTIFNGIFGVALLPINMFLNIFNFNVLGINISGIVSALLTVAMVVIVLRFVTGKKSGGD